MPRGPNFSKGTLVVTGLFTLIGLALVPTVIHPKLNPEYYREQQRWIRDKVPLEKTQPGGMKVWSDPFKRKSEK